MPNLDKTGPQGMGPTGLRQGGCVSDGASVTQRGAGRRFMGRRAMCPYFDARNTLTLEEEEKLLRTRLAEVEKEIKDTK